jgi:hypothetical protein
MALNDSYWLSQDTTFQGRVRSGMITAAISIVNEGWAVAFHRERQTYAVSVMNQPDVYKLLFTNAVSTDANCLSDATAAGTVALTSGNAATQAALVTDAHINNAISSMWNSFFRTPAQ